MELPFAESWRIKMVEPITKSTREQREEWIKAAHYNVFQLPAWQVYIDCLTDSGTGAMSDRQWAAMMMGDESYAGARSFFHMKDTITRLTGFEYVIPTRAAQPRTCCSAHSLSPATSCPATHTSTPPRVTSSLARLSP